MNNIEAQLVKIIDFWKKNSKIGNLIERELIQEIDTGGKEIIDLVGARRSGKSSILKLIIRKIKSDNFLYINFEDPFFISHNDPQIIEEIIEVYQKIYEKKAKYLFFDEIQEIEHWEKAVRKLRDAETYKIYVTGSSSKLLSREISSLITGRHLSYGVFPLSFKEFLNFKKFPAVSIKDIILKKDEIYKKFQSYLEIGGFPEPVLTNNRELLKNYFYDILERDIVRRYDVRDKDVLEKLAVFILSNSGKIISVESLRKMFNLSARPIAAYLNYLKQSFLVFELMQFSYSLKKQEKALKKYYSADLGLSNAVSFKFSEDKGRMLENVVFLELKRRGEKVYYYKTKSNSEVDFAVKVKNKFQELIQVAWFLDDEENKTREIKSLYEAMEEIKINKALILTNDHKETIKNEGKTIEILPVYEWLLDNKL